MGQNQYPVPLNKAVMWLGNPGPQRAQLSESFMHQRAEYQASLASKGGWLGFFTFFSFLTMLAFLRGALASVVSGSGGALTSLVLGLITLVALAGLLLRKRWAYYLFVALGVFLLLQLGLVMLSTPDKLLYTDWKFDVPVIFEWLMALGWVLYFLRSRRVYSVLLAKPDEMRNAT
jgi:hypothetical protein